MTAPPTWDLDSICPDGPDGEVFQRRLDALRSQARSFHERSRGLGSFVADAPAWSALLVDKEAVELEVSELVTLTACWLAIDRRAAPARAARAAVHEAARPLHEFAIALDAATDATDDAGFADFLARPEVAPFEPILARARQGRVFRLDPARESLKDAMDREGLVAWADLYPLVTSQLVANVDGKPVPVARLPAFKSHPDAAVRRAALAAGHEAVRPVRHVLAHTLTQIVGSRTQYNDLLGVDELAWPVFSNRVSRPALDAMDAACEAAREPLHRYLRQKARLLGVDRLAWSDLAAPLPGASDGPPMDWNTATGSILSAFDGFHPELGAFAREALERRWIDAAPTDGREPGGFCVSFHRRDESRVFFTFEGTFTCAIGLAHELGHAFHNRVLAQESLSRRRITPALAETASTFTETLVRDRAVEATQDPAVRVGALEKELQAAVTYLLDVSIGYRLERRLHALRRTGVLEADTLDAEVEALQRAAFGDTVTNFDPPMWCKRQHFYLAYPAFYNWPYTFGYLFSQALAARAREQGSSFLGPFRDLLLACGVASADELVRDALGEDSTDPAFWLRGVERIAAKVDAFVAATS